MSGGPIGRVHIEPEPGRVEPGRGGEPGGQVDVATRTTLQDAQTRAGERLNDTITGTKVTDLTFANSRRKPGIRRKVLEERNGPIEAVFLDVPISKPRLKIEKSVVNPDELQIQPGQPKTGTAGTQTEPGPATDDKAVQVEMEAIDPETNRDNLASMMFKDFVGWVYPEGQWKTLKGVTLIVSRTTMYTMGTYGFINGVASYFDARVGPQSWDQPAFVIGSTATVVTGAVGQAIPKFQQYFKIYKERKAKRGADNLLFASRGLQPEIDYWAAVREHAAELQQAGGVSFTHDTFINAITAQFRAMEINVPREEVAKTNIEETFNNLMAWYDATEPQFWSGSRPTFTGNGLDADSIVAQLSVLHVYKEMCVLSEELKPKNEWIWPLADDEQKLQDHIVQAYKSRGAGAAWDAMAAYRYDNQGDKIVLPRVTSIAAMINALSEVYAGL